MALEQSEAIVLIEQYQRLEDDGIAISTGVEKAT